MRIHGACHCGAISFTAEIDPARVMACHCADCQVMSGSAFRTVAIARYETLHVSGTPKAYVKVADSGNRRAQVFCPECGTPLFSMPPEHPTMVVIRLGCVRERAKLKPAAQIWQRSAMPWLTDLPAVPGSREQQAMLVPLT